MLNQGHNEQFAEIYHTVESGFTLTIFQFLLLQFSFALFHLKYISYYGNSSVTGMGLSMLMSTTTVISQFL